MQEELFENYYQVFNWCDINDYGEELERPRKVLCYKGSLEKCQKFIEWQKKISTVKYILEEYNYNEWNYPEDNNAVISNSFERWRNENNKQHD